MTERIVRQRGKADHRVVTRQLAGRHIADVARGPGAGYGGTQIAAFIQAKVKAIDVMPGRLQGGYQDGPDVAAVARYQNSQLPGLLRQSE